MQVISIKMKGKLKTIMKIKKTMLKRMEMRKESVLEEENEKQYKETKEREQVEGGSDGIGRMRDRLRSGKRDTDDNEQIHQRWCSRRAENVF